jgi:hypothetical protein
MKSTLPGPPTPVVQVPALLLMRMAMMIQAVVHWRRGKSGDNVNKRNI